MGDELDLYEFPSGYVGRKTYVSVRGHSKSVPKYKTYKGRGGINYILPEFGGDWSGMGREAAYYIPDKAGYVSPMDGKYVEGRNAHNEHMRRHNVIEVGDAKLSDFSPKEKPLDNPRYDIRRALSELTA